MMFLSFLLRACKKKNNNLVKYNALKLSYDFDLPGVISLDYTIGRGKRTDCVCWMSYMLVFFNGFLIGRSIVIFSRECIIL